MTTEKIKESELKGFLRRQSKQGGIKPLDLPKGTLLLVETERHVYQITVDDNNGKTVFIVRSSSKAIEHHHIALTIDAHCSIMKHTMDNWIGYGMRMKIKFLGVTIMTDEVRGVTIKGSNYSYDMWPELKANTLEE